MEPAPRGPPAREDDGAPALIGSQRQRRTRPGSRARRAARALVPETRLADPARRGDEHGARDRLPDALAPDGVERGQLPIAPHAGRRLTQQAARVSEAGALGDEEEAALVVVDLEARLEERRGGRVEPDAFAVGLEQTGRAIQRIADGEAAASTPRPVATTRESGRRCGARARAGPRRPPGRGGTALPRGSRDGAPVIADRAPSERRPPAAAPRDPDRDRRRAGGSASRSDPRPPRGEDHTDQPAARRPRRGRPRGRCGTAGDGTERGDLGDHRRGVARTVVWESLDSMPRPADRAPGDVGAHAAHVRRSSKRMRAITASM